MTFKTATYRDNATGLCKESNLRSLKLQLNQLMKSMGTSRKRTMTRTKTKDYEPRSHEGLHGYDSDGGFIVSDEEGNHPMKRKL